MPSPQLQDLLNECVQQMLFKQARQDVQAASPPQHPSLRHIASVVQQRHTAPLPMPLIIRIIGESVSIGVGEMVIWWEQAAFKTLIKRHERRMWKLRHADTLSRCSEVKDIWRRIESKVHERQHNVALDVLCSHDNSIEAMPHVFKHN
eukprot:12434-Heterococcus_DN1.PRE.9